MNHLPQDLRDLVRRSLDVLGKVILEEEGTDFFEKIEKIRKQTVALRGLAPKDAQKEIQSLAEILSSLNSKDEKLKVSHAFSLMLELINTCENVYRAHRLSEKTSQSTLSEKKIVWVLTAHPTEARSPRLIRALRRCQKLLRRSLDFGVWGEKDKQALCFLIKVLWKSPLSREEKARVSDEAHYIAEIAQEDQVFDSFVEHSVKSGPLELRTWVGGDKDGHPGVTEDVSHQCLQISRNRCLKHFQYYWNLLWKSTKLLSSQYLQESDFQDLKFLKVEIDALLESLKRLNESDGYTLKRLHEKTRLFFQSFEDFMGAEAWEAMFLKKLLTLFPALVIPLELREDASIVRSCYENDTRCVLLSILKRLKKISQGASLSWYASSFILSMLESAKDYEAAFFTLDQIDPQSDIPVVPLFETQHSITHMKQIVQEILEGEAWKAQKNKESLEMMLGYSDSSKEMGVLPSRCQLNEAIHEVDDYLKSQNIRSVFFHGSGGSIARGGGSVEEQSSWWPESALNPLKQTLQGEMIQRTFSSMEILKRNLEKIREVQEKGQRQKEDLGSLSLKFSNFVKDFYQKTVKDEDFLSIIREATPYPFLSELRIGSRPAKRGKEIKAITDLRAIPWILCWTQTRLLLPTWWGVGSAWSSFSDEEKNAFLKEVESSNLLKTFVKQLGFTLAKVELPVWEQYLRASSVNQNIQEKHLTELYKEYDATLEFLKKVSSSDELLWFRPWLAESIYYRAPVIHILNLLQIDSMKNEDMDLLRSTVTGVACGMLTTG